MTGVPAGAADDHAVSRHGIALDGEHRTPEQRADRRGAVPPSVVVARREDLGSGQSFEPCQVGLKVAVVLGHRQVAGKQDEVAGLDDFAPVSFDMGGMVAPPRGVTLAANRPGKRQVQVGNRPDVHSSRDGSKSADSPTKGFDRFSSPIVVAGPWPG